MNKIIVFSTRYIDDSSCIFKFATPQKTLSKSLCDYFRNVAKDSEELKKLKAKERDSNKNAINVNPDNEDHVSNITFDDIWKQAKKSIQMTDELLQKLSKKTDNLKISALKKAPFDKDTDLQKLIKNYETTKQNNNETFSDEDFLSFGNVKIDLNFDGYSRQKVKDRVTLFDIGDNNGEYRIYAVWSLGKMPEKISSPDDVEKSSWVKALINAVIEVVNDDSCEILLLLHDKDFNAIEKSDVFKSVYNNLPIDQDDKGKRSLAVFQHPQPEFNEIIELSTSDDPTNLGKTIWERADRIIRKTRIFQDLKKLQDDIVSDNVNNSEPLKELKTTYEQYWMNREFDGLRIGFELINKDINEITESLSSIMANVSSKTIDSSLNAILRSKEFDKEIYMEQIRRLDEKNPEDWHEVRQVLMPLTAYCQGKSYLKHFLISEINEHLKKQMAYGANDK